MFNTRLFAFVGVVLDEAEAKKQIEKQKILVKTCALCDMSFPASGDHKIAQQSKGRRRRQTLTASASGQLIWLVRRTRLILSSQNRPKQVKQ